MLKILIAEDDRDDVDIFTIALEDLQQPFELRRAKNGRILLEMLSEETPDFLFLDIYMPLKNGIACLTEIRKNKDYDNLLIIIFSSSQNQDNIDFFYSNNVSFYLLKQYSIRNLTNKLRYIFSGKSKSMTFNSPEEKFVVN